MIQISRKEYEEFLFLREELAQLKRLIFGKKNERYIPSDPSQAQLAFGQEIVEKEPEQQTVSYTREKKTNKQKAVRLALPAHLRREEEILEPENKQEDAVKIGEAITEILEYRPGKVYVKRYVRPKYVQSKRGEAEASSQVIVAPLPTLPIPGGNAGPGLLSHLLISKFVDHLPFYRQVQIFKREGLKLSESTISGWFKAVCKLLEPLYYELRKEVLASGYIMADESPIPVQSSNKPGATYTGYMWVYRSPANNTVMFDYQKSRSAQGPEGFLEGYCGALQTDGYAAYDRFEKESGITLLACMAHARRKFEQAQENDRHRADYALIQIQKLYALERKCKEEDLLPDQIKAARQQEAIPVLADLKEWMQQQYPKVAPKSSIGKALTYALKLWDRIVRYTDDGLWHIDNNLVENSIRPMALGRKNFLFAGSHDAAQWAAMMYSFFATCKANEVEPFQWLKKTLESLPDAKVNNIANLLPRKNH